MTLTIDAIAVVKQQRSLGRVWGDESSIVIFADAEFTADEFFIITEAVPHAEDGDPEKGYVLTGDSIRNRAYLYLSDPGIVEPLKLQLRSLVWGSNDSFQAVRIEKALSAVANKIAVPITEEDEADE